MCSCHSILECCVTFSGVKLSIRSFVLFILLTRLVTSFAWFQNSTDQAVSYNECFVIYQMTPKIMLYVATLQK